MAAMPIDTTTLSVMKGSGSGATSTQSRNPMRGLKVKEHSCTISAVGIQLVFRRLGGAGSTRAQKKNEPCEPPSFRRVQYARWPSARPAISVRRSGWYRWQATEGPASEAVLKELQERSSMPFLA